MANVVLSTAKVYSDAVVNQPWLKSKFAILADPTKFKFPLFGESILVRNVTAGNISNYDKDAGFSNDASVSGGSVTWQEIKAQYDRKYVVGVDAIDEANSILQGMTPSTPHAVARTYAKFAAEVDAVTCANIFNSIETSNVYTDTQLPLDKENILATLNRIDTMMLDNQWDEDYFVWMASDVYNTFTDALVAKNALANQVVAKEITVAARDIGAHEDVNGLAVTLSVYKYLQHMNIIVVPKSRMYSKVVLYDGKTGGQEAGGWAPDSDAKNVKLLVAPLSAVALGIRHVVANMTVPYVFQNLVTPDVNKELETLSELYSGAVQVTNIGVNQTADQIKFMGRTIYGVAVFNALKNTLLAITNTP